MDRGKKTSKLIADKNSKIYMDFKDIIRENALHFLPAKSLRRCTSVCREWKLQILTPFFAHKQSNSFRDLSGFFCQSQTGRVSFIPLEPLAYGVPDPSLSFLPEPVDIRCSSNGLICCQGRTEYKAYYICNPVTKQWKKLPKPTADHGSNPALVLIFEPSLLNFVADYKLVCAFPSELDAYEFEIYCSSKGSWRISPEICFGNRRIEKGVHVGGIIYWLPRNGSIIAFDLISERTTIIYSHASAFYHASGLSSTVGEMNGKLCSASLCSLKLTVMELSNAYTNTMQMGSKKRAWDVRRDVTLNNVEGFALDHNGSVLFIFGDMVVCRFGKNLLSYNLKTGRMAQFASEVDHNVVLIPYVNSLVEI